MFGLSYLAPLIASALISATVGSYAFARRRTKGAPAFAVAAFSQASWTFGYVFELGSETLEAKILWDDFQFVGTMGWVLGFFAFAHTYTGIPFARLRGIWFSHCLFAGGYLALVFTDRWHGLIRPRAELVTGHPFDALVYPFTPATLIISLYLFLAFGTALFQLVRQLRGVANVYRKQLAFVLAGALIPMLGTLLTLFEVLPFFHRDTTPLTFAVGNVLMAWGLFRHRLLDLVPFARDTLLEHLQDPVIVLDQRQRVLDLNPAARSLVSDSSELRLGTPCAELFSGLPELVAALSAEPAHAVEVSVNLRGERRTFAVSVKELREADGVVGRVAVAHDVSELERVQRELVERNRELEGANRELDAFAHSVSHDLRAPLRTIARFAEIALETQGKKLDDRGREQLAQVCEGTARMRALIDALLSFSSSGRQPLTKHRVSPGAMVREIIAELGGSAGARNAEFQVSELPECSADPMLLRQVFANLIDNALKYSRDKTPAQIAIGSQSHRGTTLYFVRDNGAGFDMRYAERLFGVFQRLHDAKQYEGNGVGLAIVQRIVARHGGRVWAEAAVDAGATFYFTLSAEVAD